MTKDIDIGLIFPSPTARAIDKANVSKLVLSMSQVGMISPIVVRPCIRHKGTTPYDAYRIVVGHHRYRAACDLKWPKVRCEIVEMDDLHAELAEIDENLIRANLSPAQEAQAIARRKAIYELMHPETRAEANASAARKTSGNLSFVSSTSDAIGKDKRTVERAAARGRALGDDLSSIAGTSLDKGAELDALAKMPLSERASVISRARAGENVSARSPKPPKIAADPLTDELAAEAQVAKLMAAWNAAGPDARAEFLLRIDQPIMDARYGSPA